jgi:hypothetical protein
MPRVFRKLGVCIAVLCIVLMLLFLTVKEVGRFCHALDPGTDIRAERASLTQEASLLLAALVIATVTIHVLRDTGLSLATVVHSPFPGPLSSPFSTLRC